MEINRSEQELVRRGKLDSIREYCNPYPEKYEITHSIKEAKKLEDGITNVKIAVTKQFQVIQKHFGQFT